MNISYTFSCAWVKIWKLKRLASLQPSHTFYFFLEYHGQFARPQLIKNNTITASYGLHKNMLATRKNSIRFSEITIICQKNFFFFFFLLSIISGIICPSAANQNFHILCIIWCTKKHVTDANEFYTFLGNHDSISGNIVPRPFLQFWSLIS